MKMSCLLRETCVGVLSECVHVCTTVVPDALSWASRGQGDSRMWLNYRGKARYLGLTETSIAGTPSLPPSHIFSLCLSFLLSLLWKWKNPAPRNHNSWIRAGGERKSFADGIAEYGLWGHKQCTNALYLGAVMWVPAYATFLCMSLLPGIGQIHLIHVNVL